jgi:putative DNA primase/helicase
MSEGCQTKEEPPGARTREELFEHLRSIQHATAKSGMYSCFESWCDSEGVFNPALLAEDIVSNNHVKTDAASDTMYFYDEDQGFYNRNGDDRVRALIEACLASENRQHRTTEVTYLVHSKTLTTLEPSRKIALMNGLLDPETQTLEDFTPDEFVTNKLPVKYDADAKCPEIIKFFSEIAPSDVETMFEEIFGYCLLRELPIHKATVLLGEGANGKSTFLDLLTLFLGKDNVSHVTLQQMCEGKFELAELHGKLANIVDDLPGASLKAVGNFKTVTGNAPILVQRKHKDPFNVWSTTKHLFGCNKIPKSPEDTIAYYRRFNIVPFNRFFTGTADDKAKLKKISAPRELSGMLNLALSGLKRLIENGDYSRAKSTEETRQLMIKSSDSCKSFAEEKLEESESPEDYITTEATYQMYVAYCHENRLPKIERKPILDAAVRQNFPNVEHSQIRIEGKKPFIWRYLKVKSVLPVLPVLALVYSSKSQPDSNLYRRTKTSKTAKTDCLIPCPECKAKGKPMFFGSDGDLRTHMSACHYSEEPMQEVLP